MSKYNKDILFLMLLDFGFKISHSGCEVIFTKDCDVFIFPEKLSKAHYSSVGKYLNENGFMDLATFSSKFINNKSDKLFKKILIEMASWEDNMNKHEMSEIPYYYAKISRVDKVFEKYKELIKIK